MIFVMEYEKGHPWRFHTVISTKDEINPSEFKYPIKNLFFCETIDEAIMVIDELTELNK